MNLQQALREYVLKQYLKGQAIEGFDDDYNLIDDGIMDSLAIINTVAHLEKHYGIEFDDGDIVPEHFLSVNALSAFVLSKQGIKERGRNNFPNYASQLQATFARSQITKISK